MKTFIFTLSWIALAGWSAAQVPSKAPLSRYNSLWTNSPFTSKPPPTGPVEEKNVLEDYALAGVTPIDGGGYRVIMMEKKQPDVRITVDSGDSRSGFKILAVTRKSGDPLGTVVRMSSGSKTGTVSYDDKLLTIASAPKATPGAPGGVGGANGNQPQLQNGMNNPNGQPQIPGGAPGQIRQPRPRVVPPPTPQAGTPQIQQGQPAQQTLQRPDRRRN